MSEATVNIGVSFRNPVDEGKAARAFPTLARYAEAAGTPLCVVMGVSDPAQHRVGEDGFFQSNLLLRARHDEVIAEPVRDPVAVHSLRNRTFEITPTRTLLLNAPSVIAIRDKGIMADVFADVMPATLSWRPGEELPDLDQLPGSIVVVKPTQGSFSKSVDRHEKSDVAERLRQATGALVIQELVNTTYMSPMKPLTERDERLLAAATGAKQLRLVAVNNQLIPVLHVARTDGWEMSKNDYVAIDPEPVPDSAYQVGQLVVDRLKAWANTPAIYGAIDLYATPERKHEWLMGEINVKSPVMPKEDHYPYPARLIKAQVIEQLITMAIRASRA